VIINYGALLTGAVLTLRSTDAHSTDGALLTASHLKQSVLLVGSQIKPGIEFQVIGPATENA